MSNKTASWVSIFVAIIGLWLTGSFGWIATDKKAGLMLLANALFCGGIWCAAFFYRRHLREQKKNEVGAFTYTNASSKEYYLGFVLVGVPLAFLVSIILRIIEAF